MNRTSRKKVHHRFLSKLLILMFSFPLLFLLLTDKPTEAFQGHGLTFQCMAWSISDKADEWEYKNFYYSQGGQLPAGTYYFEQYFEEKPSISYCLGMGGFYRIPKRKSQLNYGFSYSFYGAKLKTATSKWESDVLVPLKESETGPFHILSLYFGGTYYFYRSNADKRWVPFLGADIMISYHTPQIEDDEYHAVLSETDTDDGLHYFFVPEIGIAYTFSQKSRLNIGAQYRRQIAAAYFMEGFVFKISYGFDI